MKMNLKDSIKLTLTCLLCALLSFGCCAAALDTTGETTTEETDSAATGPIIQGKIVAPSN
jgi:hypothetical protein